MPKPLPDLTVIRDTREKNGWHFAPEEKHNGKIRITGTVVEYLDSADYSVKGYEDLVRIERKNGFSELFGNMTPIENKNRFEDEMERMRNIPHKYILVETVLSNDTLGLSLPQFRTGVPCSAVAKWLTELEIKYDVHIWFVGDTGKRVAKMIFDSVVRKYL